MKKVFAISVFATTALVGPAHAAFPGLGTVPGWEVGGTLSSYRYDEQDDTGAAFMNLKGSKLGVVGSYTKGFSGDWRDWFLTVDGRLATGETEYEGSGKASGKTDTLTEVRAVAARDYQFPGYTLSPFGGLGLRTLYNDLRGNSSTGAAGYRRYSTYVYMPLGLTHRMAVSADARLSTTVEYDVLLSGQQVSRLSDTGVATDVTNNQPVGRGLRLGTAYETEKWSAGVFYQVWDIAKSDPSTFVYGGTAYTGVEPKNMTQEFGVQVKYRFN